MADFFPFAIRENRRVDLRGLFGVLDAAVAAPMPSHGFGSQRFRQTTTRYSTRLGAVSGAAKPVLQHGNCAQIRKLCGLRERGWAIGVVVRQRLRWALSCVAKSERAQNAAVATWLRRQAGKWCKFRLGSLISQRWGLRLVAAGVVVFSLWCLRHAGENVRHQGKMAAPPLSRAPTLRGEAAAAAAAAATGKVTTPPLPHAAMATPAQGARCLPLLHLRARDRVNRRTFHQQRCSHQPARHSLRALRRQGRGLCHLTRRGRAHPQELPGDDLVRPYSRFPRSRRPGSPQACRRKYQFMEVNTQRRAAGLKDKIPDIQKTLDTVRFLKTRKVPTIHPASAERAAMADIS